MNITKKEAKLLIKALDYAYSTCPEDKKEVLSTVSEAWRFLLRKIAEEK